ncbi:MAG: PRC-barrel domain-containing protein [Flavisolibacter sp.]
MSNDNMKHRRLQELDESDFEIVDGQPDIRGWDVKTGDGTTIGEVDELILDARERKVRYMLVDLDEDKLDLDENRKVLIPIGTAQLHEKEDELILEGITIEQLRHLPEYDSDNLTEETEYAISSALGRSGSYSSKVMNKDFYKHEHFNENNLYQRRLPENSSSTGLSSDQSNYLQSRDDIADTAEENYNSYDGRERNFVEEEVNGNVISPVSNSADSTPDKDDRDENETRLRRDADRRYRRDRDDRPGSIL